MALADPQVLPTSPDPTDLDRVSAVLGRFASEDTKYQLSVDHSRGNRARHVVKLTQRKIATDPLLPSQNREYTQSVHIVIDHPIQGFSASEISELAQVFVDFLDDPALLSAVVQGQA
jgi:hypothetical protein